MGLNDPQWGRKKGNSGPPDLEELWLNFNKKLNNIFGRKRPNNGQSGGEEGPGNGNFKRYTGGMGAGLFAGLIFLLWLASGFYIVNEGQRGLILRFGQYTQTTQAGLRWHFPYPIENVENVNVSQVRTVEIGYRNNVKSKVLKESLMLTDDENIIDIQFAVQYILKNPEEFLFNNRDPEEAVLQAAETSIREVIGKSKMDFVLYEGREQVAAKATQLMQDILDRYKIGIAISKVTMQNAQPPEQVQAAFDDAVKAGQDRERQKNEGQAYANDVIPKAKGNAARLIEESDGYKQRVIVSSEGDANRFKKVLIEYNKAPNVTRDRLYLDMMQQVLSSTSKVLVDQKNGNNLLYLPLDKLMQTVAPPLAQVPEIPIAVTPEPVIDNASRTREAFRSRERESR
ncbi:MAG: FtsH protease activity modulator HflK [Nitrosospira sp.]|nr:FtsH protease activity modulator HflK [Nitrosospira sp.]MBI0415176.1 FtsH protease activity modulator HflK [Nitrosospira sp.]MBI0417049.1 FtsH protease activity modulator HflK [Nitrosospira sp.]MBI0419201.1 FtsH protease activity modulator HflK [Nitrosospira sp.]